MTLRRLALALAVLAVALVATLALPVSTWRTGDQGLAPLRWQAVPAVEPPGRLWIDTDAACGTGPRVDPDDCLAVAALLRAWPGPIAGVSTVFGNAALAQVDRTTAALLRVIAPETGRAVPHFSGLGEPLAPGAPAPPTPAAEALVAALEAGPLTIVALGPLSNIAAVLGARPELAARVTRLVAVMGRRPGHLFHPAEGARARTLLGHGPVLRDFNFAQDGEAALRVLRLGLPTTLVPYDAARGIEVTPQDVDALAARNASGAWLAERARDWLAWWREDIGRAGFYPFDLLAAAHLLDPARLRCAEVTAWIGTDRTLFLPFWRRTALLVDQRRTHVEDPQAVASALYCAKPAEDLKAWLWRRLG